MSAELETRKTFVFYRNWAVALLQMPDEYRLMMLDAILNYFLNNEEPQTPLVKVAFELYRQKMDEDAEAYKRKIEIKRENGSKGGGQPGNQNARKRAKTSENEQKRAVACLGEQIEQNDLVNDNVNENINKDSKEIDVHFSDEKCSEQYSIDEFEKIIVSYFNESIQSSWGKIFYPVSDRRKPKIKNFYNLTKGNINYAKAILKHAIINAVRIIDDFSPKKAFDQILSHTNIGRITQSFKDYANNQNC